jgi:hypothetical protein
MAILLIVSFAASSSRASVHGTAQPAGTEDAVADSFIVDHYITDAILHRKWAVVVDHDHPDRPWIVKEAPWQSRAGMAAVSETNATRPAIIARPLVSAGAKVRLWRTADGADIELTGTALEAGAEGQTIHVRTGQRGTVLKGRVRGMGSVELFTSDRWATQ